MFILQDPFTVQMFTHRYRKTEIKRYKGITGSKTGDYFIG